MKQFGHIIIIRRILPRIWWIKSDFLEQKNIIIDKMSTLIHF